MPPQLSPILHASPLDLVHPSPSPLPRSSLRPLRTRASGPSARWQTPGQVRGGGGGLGGAGMHCRRAAGQRAWASARLVCACCPSLPPHSTLTHVPSPLASPHPPAVEEKGGFVWVFYGSRSLPADARPPIPYCDELGALGRLIREGVRCLHEVQCLHATGAQRSVFLHSLPTVPRYPAPPLQTTPPGRPCTLRSSLMPATLGCLKTQSTW